MPPAASTTAPPGPAAACRRRAQRGAGYIRSRSSAFFASNSSVVIAPLLRSWASRSIESAISWPDGAAGRRGGDGLRGALAEGLGDVPGVLLLEVQLRVEDRPAELQGCAHERVVQVGLVGSREDADRPVAEPPAEQRLLHRDVVDLLEGRSAGRLAQDPLDLHHLLVGDEVELGPPLDGGVDQHPEPDQEHDQPAPQEQVTEERVVGEERLPNRAARPAERQQGAGDRREQRARSSASSSCRRSPHRWRAGIRRSSREPPVRGPGPARTVAG